MDGMQMISTGGDLFYYYFYNNNDFLKIHLIHFYC